MPAIPARWLKPLDGRHPQPGEVVECLRRGNRTDKRGWSEEEITRFSLRLTEIQDKNRPHHSRRTLWGRVPLISASLTGSMARPWEFLTRKWGLFLLAFISLSGMASFRYLPEINSVETAYWLPAFLMFFTGAIIHELGHAAALSAQGYPAGGIGGGVLYFIPVLHNDVSAMSLLNTTGKLRVDLSGVAFQAAYGGVLVVIGHVFKELTPSINLAVKMTWMAVGWSLIPFIRADGYWALCDALGLKDLNGPVDPNIGAVRRGVLMVHRVLNIVFLVVVSVYLPLKWMSRLLEMAPESWVGLVRVVLGLGLVFLWLMTGRRVWGLVRGFMVDFR